ncbi:hypothetical protein AB6813_19810 [bacterium RCC_150]
MPSDDQQYYSSMTSRAVGRCDVDEEPGLLRLHRRLRRALRISVFAVVIAVALCVALGILPYIAATVMIPGILAGGLSSADRKVPTEVSGGFVWWKRRVRGTFYTDWIVLILMTGMLVNYMSARGVDWAALLFIGVMVRPLWVILRKPPKKPWDPARLTK